MGVVTWGADRMLLQWLPGDTLPMQVLRLALVIALSLGALAAAAAALAHSRNSAEASATWCVGGSEG